MEKMVEPVSHVSAEAQAEQELARYNNLILIGYSLLAASLILYGVFEYVALEKFEQRFTVFVLHYLIALGYTLALLMNGSLGILKSWRIENIDKTVVLLNLFLISAYALNRELPVFASSTSWLCVYLFVTSLCTLSYRYFSYLNIWVNRLQHIVLGSAIILYAYLAVYVANVYTIGSIGMLFFGIGGHVFVPLIFFTACVFLIMYARKSNKISIYWIPVGSSVTLIVVLAFMGEWNSRISKIEKLSNQSILYQNNGLPIWVKVAQDLKTDWISERIIKSDLVYTTYNRYNWDFFPGDTQWDEVRKHDPLVFIASLVSRCTLSHGERVKILQSVFSDRHYANERLWSGDNLTTAYIVSDVDIYPSLRLAYTEKYLSIRNNAPPEVWRADTQEAIYTFQLPEGSVVTSLSLWIEGKEEKGILTSKQKATNAYKTIVGVERRDPSVIHWQEGNTVSVRVFPCTPEEERKFKIGITSPLIEQEGELMFKNVSFRGPSSDRSPETFRVRFVGSSDNIIMPANFNKDINGDYVAEQLYDPDFNISFKATPLQASQFSFDGFTYSMETFLPRFEPAKVDQIFLDINDTWTRAEIAATEAWILTHKVYAVSNNDFIQLTDENWQDITDENRQRNFSIFPFHKISNEKGSLVITKGKSLSPHLSDFKESKFSEDVGKYFASGKRIKVYNLEGSISTYVGALRELRGLEFASGNIDQLNRLLAEGKFPKLEESEGQVVLHDAKLRITKKRISGEHIPENNAPDHLARLFAYNNIMRKVGVHYFNDDFICEDLVDEAASAYVVSPVSSLIVLESQADYERFGIEDKVNSLHNATKESTGAVPEPHEWVLIILFTLFLVYLQIRSNKLRVSL